MTPFYADSLATLYQGDVLDVLRQLPSGSVQCIVTSPPYFGLRDYGLPRSVWGGDPECAHEWNSLSYQRRSNDGGKEGTKQGTNLGANGRDVPIEHALCCHCNAWLGCLGLEPSPELFIEHCVVLFREVRRVLRDDGTLWLNIGDSYNGSGGAGGDYGAGGLKEGQPRYPGRHLGGDLKPKDLIGIPWMLAFALRADGWYLRSDIIWHKPNAMPESVTDRPAKAHEYVFLLTKSARYFYDADAVREPNVRLWDVANNGSVGKNGYKDHTPITGGPPGTPEPNPAGRNKRTVWTIATAPYAAAHFATYPPALVEPCILAGTSQRGACPHCGTAWRRTSGIRPHGAVNIVTHGWEQSCACPAAEPVPCAVLEPFAGSGTTLMVAKRLVRRSIGIDLSADYLALAVERIKSAEPGIQLDMMSTWELTPTGAGDG
jgi:DNA modification methylase